MKTYKEFVQQEDVSVGGGALGAAAATGHGGAVGNSDWYAPGDTRMPKALGAKKIKGKKAGVLVQRRNLVNT
ncbi:MAG: hypothetical protein EB127_01425 [Alphaproteobacteria bacterium]|nr:hypothetical protein [Alphaproteobacteria bacterium]